MAKDFVDVHETPALQKWIPLSLQHLFAMFGATVLVPLITGLDVQVALLTSGLGTLLFLFITNGKLPNYLGSSFAFIGPIITVLGTQGPGAAMLGCFLSGIIYMLVALIVAKVGVDWLNRLLPPLVIASIIIVIGLSLSSVAVGWAVNDPLSKAQTPLYSLHAVEVAFITMIVAVISSIYLKGFFSVIPILTGMIVGYLYTLVRYPQWIDFQSIAKASWFVTPADLWQHHMLTGKFLAALQSPSAWMSALIIAPIAFVTLAEHIGHLLVTGRVMNRDLIRDPGLHRSLLGDGVATALAAFIGGPPSTTYGENIGVLAITRVFSRNVIGLAAVFAVCFAFIGKIGAILMTIPKPVLGGVCIILFGIIAAQGVRMYVEHQIDFAEKRNMIIAAIILITGIGGLKLNLFTNLTIDNIAMATVLGVVLHAILPGKESAFGAVPEEESLPDKKVS